MIYSLRVRLSANEGRRLNWLITGGAGYIGAHVVESTLASGRDIVVLDDLSTGISGRISQDIPLYQISFKIHDAVQKFLRRNRFLAFYTWRLKSGLGNLLSALITTGKKMLVECRICYLQ
jgi:NAD(P)-dependent dehydrogenase (short-subunit alcohol dehydrogenase family)